MPLFQHSILKKYVGELDNALLDAAWQRFHHHFHNAIIQQNILHAKEEEYQEGFVRDLFVNVLGYTLKPQPDYNLVLEQKSTSDATKSDGAILSAEGNVIAVIELKDTTTADLGKVERQAFGYKHQHKDCRYIITSNFQQLRFYVNDAIDFEAFDLFRLDKNAFALLYCCLKQKALQSDVPLRMKQQSLAAEENVTRKLYEDYSGFKKQLFENISDQNPQYDRLLLFKKTQKLLDRFLFLLFAEDRGLLPPNSVREILQQWEKLKELDNYVPLYDRFKKFFGYLNTGYSNKQYEIFAYNGGLFAPDEILDNITIDDALLYESCKGLSNYDFESEVDVNILGHIFEHSLNEIEEIEQGSSPLGGGRVGARKKDGVFYTPRYITKYIVENTVGALCTEVRKELNIIDEDFVPQKRKAATQQLLEKLEMYREWLLHITICDPACGSGAFLNQALEFLIAEHQSIDTLKAKLFGDAIAFTDVENSILENNLYGVDINEEAVEIAKLSLWLRTARKGRKLNSLSNNIKCGNSLIDDPAVAGAKAFNWEKEFPAVCKDTRGYFQHAIKEFEEILHDYKPTQEQLDKVFEQMDKKYFPDIEAKWGKPITGVKDFVEAGLTLINGEKTPMMWLRFLERNEAATELLQEFSENNRIPFEIVFTVIIEKFMEDLDANFDDYADAFTPDVSTGFDVVIGNPPYVRAELFPELKDYLQKSYKTFQPAADLFSYFYEKSFKILKANGLLGFISNAFDKTSAAIQLRNWIQHNVNLKLYIDFTEVQIFEGATTYPVIIIANNSINNDGKFDYIKIKKQNVNDINAYISNVIIQKQLVKENWVFHNNLSYEIIAKIKRYPVITNRYQKSYYGIKTALNEAFIIPKNSIPYSPAIKPIFEGKELSKWINKKPEQDLILIKSKWTKSKFGNLDESIAIEKVKELYPKIIEHLLPFKEKAVKRFDKGDYWWELRNCAYYDLFEQPKIVFPNLQNSNKFSLEVDGAFLSAPAVMLSLAHLKNPIEEGKILLSILNSRIIWFFLKSICVVRSGGYIEVKPQYFEQIPIPEIVLEQQLPFIAKADIMLSKNKELQAAKKQFLQFFYSKYESIIITKKLQDWPSLSFSQFLKELDKQKVKLSLSAQAEWMQYFETEKSKANVIQQLINKTDKEIDEMVYELYGLTEEERKVVEEG